MYSSVKVINDENAEVEENCVWGWSGEINYKEIARMGKTLHLVLFDFIYTSCYFLVHFGYVHLCIIFKPGYGRL